MNILHQYGIQWGFIWNKVEGQFACDRGNQSRRNSMMELFTPVLIKMLRQASAFACYGKKRGRRAWQGEQWSPAVTGRPAVSVCSHVCMCVHVCIQMGCWFYRRGHRFFKTEQSGRSGSAGAWSGKGHHCSKCLAQTECDGDGYCHWNKTILKHKEIIAAVQHFGEIHLLAFVLRVRWENEHHSASSRSAYLKIKTGGDSFLDVSKGNRIHILAPLKLIN